MFSVPTMIFIFFRNFQSPDESTWNPLASTNLSCHFHFVKWCNVSPWCVQSAHNWYELIFPDPYESFLVSMQGNTLVFGGACAVSQPIVHCIELFPITKKPAKFSVRRNIIGATKSYASIYDATTKWTGGAHAFGVIILISFVMSQI